MSRYFLAGILFLALSFGLPLDTAAPAAQQGDPVTDQVFTDLEKRIIGEYFDRVQAAVTDEDEDDDDEGAGKGKNKNKNKSKNKNKNKGQSGDLPPGLAKRDELPPGLAMRETLPPGLDKRDLPADLEGSLPLREGIERIIAGDAVVLVDEVTGVVLDILEGVIVPESAR